MAGTVNMNLPDVRFCGELFGPTIAQSRQLISHLITEVIIGLESDAMAESKKHGMPLDVYQQLWELHAGFEQVRRALRGLGQQSPFNTREVGRLAAGLEEARAAAASYLTGAIEE